jgi:hypothetical protein
VLDSGVDPLGEIRKAAIDIGIVNEFRAGSGETPVSAEDK